MDFVSTTYLVFDSSPAIEVPNRDTAQAFALRKSFHHSFYFYDRITATVKFKGEDVKLQSLKRNKSQLYLIGGSLHTLHELKGVLPHDHTVIHNLRQPGSETDKAYKDRGGGYTQVPGDSIVLPLAA